MQEAQKAPMYRLLTPKERTTSAEIVAVRAGFRKTRPKRFGSFFAAFAHKTQKGEVGARILLIAATFVALCWVAKVQDEKL